MDGPEGWNLKQDGKTAAQAAQIARLVGIVDDARARISGLLEAKAVTSEAVASFNRLLNYQLFAQDSYFDTSISQLLPEGSRRVTDELELRAAGTSIGALVNKESGYFGALYELADGSLVLANRGSEPVANDWIANGLQAIGLASKQYAQAMTVAQGIAEKTKNISFIGHSLGGGLASAQALTTGKHAVIFDSAGVNKNTVGAKAYAREKELIQSFNTSGEILTYLQTDGKKQGGLALATFGGPYGAALGLMAQMLPAVPNGVPQVQFPAYDPTWLAKGKFVPMPALSARPDQRLKDRIALHAVDILIASTIASFELNAQPKPGRH